jgi:hypothetical protein
MKKILLFAALTMSLFPLCAQNNKTDMLQDLENKNTDNQNITATATLKSATRLFADENDLTTVIQVIPAGSNVSVLGSDSTYLHVIFEDNEGYILKRHATIDKTQTVTTQSLNSQQKNQDSQADQSNQAEEMSRFTYLENKYGTNMAARLNAGKIWKGMNSDMVKDSWGNALKISRVISGNIIQENWFYQNTWLYFENNVLVDWGPIKK